MTNILVVADDPNTHAELTRALAGPQRAIEVAAHDEALASVGRRRPHLVIADVTARLNGALLVQQLREAPETARIPVIVMTGVDCPVYRVQGFRVGIDDYVTKPVDLDELALRAETVLRRTQGAARGPALTGDLARFGLATPLAMLELERCTGVLVIERPNDRGMLVMKNGHIVRGELKSQVGGSVVECVCELLAWDSGRFSFDEQLVDDEDNDAPTTAILLEATRKMDELIPVD
jgi:DNA-binding response OmpR family regulator